MPAYRTKDAVDLAQNEALGPIDIRKLRRPVITVQTGPANNAGAAVSIQGRVIDEMSWKTFTYTKEDATTAASLVGVDKIGTVDSSVLGACGEVRAVRTDANGGVCQVAMGISDNS